MTQNMQLDILNKNRMDKRIYQQRKYAKHHFELAHFSLIIVFYRFAEN
jgi:hypothetical protein